MISHLFNAYEYESIDCDREIVNSLDHKVALEDLLTEWFSPDYLQD